MIELNTENNATNQTCAELLTNLTSGRNIIFMFSFTPVNSSKQGEGCLHLRGTSTLQPRLDHVLDCCLIIISDRSDFISDTSNYILNNSSPRACVEVAAMNDSIPESNEVFSISVEFMSPFVTLIGKGTEVIINDDDGECYLDHRVAMEI